MKNKPNRRFSFTTIACTAIFLIAPFGLTLAQSDYPSKPVKIIVPFPAGGTSDVMGRLVAEELGKSSSSLSSSRTSAALAA